LGKHHPKRFYFARLEIAVKFASTSAKFGYDAEDQQYYEDALLDLQDIWEQQGYIEIYDPSSHGYSAHYPLAKDSNSVAGSSPDYTGLYHARLLKTGEVDPLVIVTFQGMIVVQQRYERAVIEALIYHDLMFLPMGQKTPQNKKKQREWVRHNLDSSDENAS
jgi:hypothetical protein